MTEDTQRRLPSIDVAAFSAPAPAPAPPTLHTVPGPPTERADRHKRAPQEKRSPGEGTPRAAKKASATSDGRIVTVGVNIASSTRELLRSAAAAESSLTQTGVMLAAIAATRTQLAAQFAQPTTGPGPFETTTAVRRTRHHEAWVQVSLRVTEKDLATIDDIVQECNSPDRSRMVDTAVRMYLATGAASAAT